MIKVVSKFFLLVVIFLAVTSFRVIAQEQVSFDLVDLKKYSTDYYKYKYKLPLFNISIKNTGSVPITSRKLDCDVSFIDISNKKVITEYRRNLLNEFKSIDPGFTSPPINFEILSVKKRIVNTIGQRPIDFIIKAKVVCEQNSFTKEATVVFQPSDYDSLPSWD